MKKITFIIMLFCAGFINAQKKNYTIKNIETNTKYQDFGVAYYGENKAVFASTRNKKTIRKNLWLGNEQPFLELYQGVLAEDGEINEVENFSKIINSKFHDANVIFTKDLKTIYFTRNNYLDKKFKKDSTGWNLNQLYKAQIMENGDWSNIQPMPFNSDNYQTGHPVLNSKENKLYFISDMPGTYGETDIYMVDIHTDGTYGSPKNLGPTVNTLKKEMFPFIDENDVLYFASDGYIDGLGGLDIYTIQIEENEAVGIAKNLGSPINSFEDDFSLVFQQGKKVGYFSSNRPGGKGDDDIYFFKEDQPLKLECTQIVKGVAKEKGTGDLLPGTLVDLFDNKGNSVLQLISDENGEFMFDINCETFYKVVGSKQDYTNGIREIKSSDIHGHEISLNLILEKNESELISEMLALKINPIYFDLDKSSIRFDAEKELVEVVALMKKYPEIKIKLASHTDCRASENYNLDLSNRRAKASVDWVVSQGINPKRITGKGYGETQLVNKCSNGVKCSETQHQLNRRTEFEIIYSDVIGQ